MRISDWSSDVCSSDLSARGLGFSIDEIRSLKALAAGPEQDCDEVRALAARHLLDVDERLERMVRLRAELARIVQLCEGGRLADCRVIEANEATRPSAVSTGSASGRENGCH